MVSVSRDESRLEIVVEDHALQPVVVLTGELDWSTASEMIGAVRRLLRVPPPGIAMDLRAVDFMDLAGARALIVCRRLTATRGSAFVLRRPSDGAQRILQLSGLGAVFTIE